MLQIVLFWAEFMHFAVWSNGDPRNVASGVPFISDPRWRRLCQVVKGVLVNIVMSSEYVVSSGSFRFEVTSLAHFEFDGFMFTFTVPSWLQTLV